MTKSDDDKLEIIPLFHGLNVKQKNKFPIHLLVFFFAF